LLGSPGNSQAFENGGSELNGVPVSDPAMNNSSSLRLTTTAGTYLQINPECQWKVEAVDEP
jgi:hypothetical protein